MQEQLLTSAAAQKAPAKHSAGIQKTPAFGGLALAARMYMARCELSGIPRVTVYEVDPIALHMPDHNKPRARVVPRQARSWYGDAKLKICSPGFAAFGGNDRQALESLLRLMQAHRDRGGMVPAISEAIRAVTSKLEACIHAGSSAV